MHKGFIMELEEGLGLAGMQAVGGMRLHRLHQERHLGTWALH